MKKILGLIASQRKLANGELLAKEVAAAAGDDCQLELLRLTDLYLEPCRGCYTCLTPGTPCPIGDGLYFLTEKMKAADGIILAAPCYAGGPAAVTKLLGDRIIALAQLIDDFWGKPCVVISTAGIAGGEGYTATALNTMVRFLGLDLKDSHVFLGALPGEGVVIEGALARAGEMGRALFGQARRARDGECPACWAEAWKLTDTKSMECTICGQTASLVPKEAGVEWVYGNRSEKFAKDRLKDHFQQWLRDKVQEFISRRKELTDIRSRYKGNEIWLKPEKS